MTTVTDRKRALLEQIDTLLNESYALPRTRESWERRTEIEWDILRLCRAISDLSSGPLPYWFDERTSKDEAASNLAPSPRDLRQRLARHPICLS